MIDTKNIDLEQIDQDIRAELKAKGMDPHFAEMNLRGGRLMDPDEAARKAGVSTEMVRHLLRAGVALDGEPAEEELTLWAVEQLKVIAAGQ